MLCQLTEVNYELSLPDSINVHYTHNYNKKLFMLKIEGPNCKTKCLLVLKRNCKSNSYDGGDSVGDSKIVY